MHGNTRSCAVGATWQIRLNDQTTSSPKYDVHAKFHADRICIAGLPKMTYTTPICANVFSVTI